jgi:hypothetical protein
VDDPIRADATRAELGELGLKHFLDVRATVRRMLDTMSRPERAAFAAAAAERMLREDESLPPGEHRAYLATWRPVLDTVWAGLSGEPAADRAVCRAVGHYYLLPEYSGRRHDDPGDADDHAVMAVFYAAECYLHGCLEFAAWAGWRAFDGATMRAAGDKDWPHRRPPGLSAYSWELAHPAVQAELDRQLEDLELLDEAGEVPAALDRLRPAM